MDAHAASFEHTAYPVAVEVTPALADRNRVTTAFRFFLGLPHLFLVGGPVAAIFSIEWTSHHNISLGWGSGGVLSLIAGIAVCIAWFAILITGHYPAQLRQLAEWYLRWRVRAISYMTLLRDEYPPFGEGSYPVDLRLEPATGPRDRVTIAFRILMALPHMFVLWFLGVGWALGTAFAWLHILATGRYPETLYGFAIGVLAWSTRLEAYMLLLTDEYPPFTLRA